MLHTQPQVEPAKPRSLTVPSLVLQSFLAALAFLTVLPIRFRMLPAEQVMARSRLWYPLVGLLLGGSLGAAAYGLGLAMSPSLAAFLALTLWIVSTGALHLDGLADTADGLFGGRDAEERLAIMRDPHAGTFGVVACTLMLLGKWIVLRELFAIDAWIAAHALAASVFVARCGILLMTGLSRYARTEGTGKAVVSAAGLGDALLGVTLAILLNRLFGPECGCAPVLCSASWSLLAVLVLTWVCQRRLRGVTGDCLGAAVELAELAYLFAAGIKLGLPG
jgi:adenosylcobinamide-GDP ribazoletransferase